MEALLLAIIGLTNIACFMIGAKVGQTVNKGEEIKLPTVNPLEIYREREEKRQAKVEQDKLETIMQNIENYDGTSNGQKNVG